MSSGQSLKSDFLSAMMAAETKPTRSSVVYLSLYADFVSGETINSLNIIKVFMWSQFSESTRHKNEQIYKSEAVHGEGANKVKE